jgi:hypothetical protein
VNRSIGSTTWLSPETTNSWVMTAPTDPLFLG